MGNYCPYTNGNVIYLQCKECEEKLCEKDWFFCGVAGTPLSMMKSGKQMSEYLVDILPTAKAGGFLHQPPLHSNRGCCVLHDVRQALLPVCPTVRYVFIKLTFAQALYAKY